MANITMCDNKKCSMRETCYRFRAKPSAYQLYSIYKPKDDDCSHYVEYVPHIRKADKAIDW